jgi:NTE family protein
MNLLQRRTAAALLLVASVLGSNAPVMALESDEKVSDRPRIGVALSGGGARGVSHIGVLRVLDEMRIPIDYIAGTSMGSIIAGLYASGMTPDEIESAVKEMDWEHIFSDDPPRQERSFRRKRDDDLYLVASKPGFREGELKFPTGAIQGQKFDLALRQLTMPVNDVTNFDDFYIPFRAVATDMANGHPVVLGSGDLARALRASMSVPGVFAATEIDGKLLVDGGISSNLPINQVRAMGADIVIAVDIGSPNMPAEKVTNLLEITAQLTSIMTRVNVEQQIATLTGKDVLIVPELDDFSSSDFVNATDIIPLGRQGAENERSKLAQLSMPAEGYQQYLAARKPRPVQQVPEIQFVDIVNNSGVGDDSIRDRLHQQIGQPLDREQLEKDIATIYGLELFQTVHYEVVEKNGRTGLQVQANARSWGPDYLQTGMELSSDQRGRSSYNLGLAYQKTAINKLGGELRTGIQFGQESSISGDWHQPLDSLSRFFTFVGARYGTTNVGIYDSQGDDRLADFRVEEMLLDTAIGREFGQLGEFRVGYRYRTGDVELSTGTPSPDFEDFSYDSGVLYSRLSIDNLDNYNFPTTGWLGSLEYDASRDEYGSDVDFDQVKFRVSRFFTFSDTHTIGLLSSVSATVDGTVDIQDRYTLGGLFNLSGYADGALSGQQKGLIGAVYYKRTEILPFLSWYVGASAEYGGVWEEKSDIFDDRAMGAGSLFIGADTPVGPLYIGYGHAESSNNAIYFSLGRPQYQ